jgi:hypothetical protein
MKKKNLIQTLAYVQKHSNRSNTATQRVNLQSNT